MEDPHGHPSLPRDPGMPWDLPLSRLGRRSWWSRRFSSLESNHRGAGKSLGCWVGLHEKNDPKTRPPPKKKQTQFRGSFFGFGKMGPQENFRDRYLGWFLKIFGQIKKTLDFRPDLGVNIFRKGGSIFVQFSKARTSSKGPTQGLQAWMTTKDHLVVEF